MINPEKRVETYLLNCGLAINLMLEVKDHMMSQLNELWEEGQDFEEAFDIVKNEWQRELEPVKMWLFSAGRMPRIQKRMLAKQSEVFWKWSFAFSFSVLAVFAGAAKLLSKEIFVYLYEAYYVLDFVVVSYILISNYKIFLLKRRFNLYKIAASQYLMSSFFSGALFISLELVSFDYRPAKFYENAQYLQLFSPFLWILVANGFLIYGILAFLNYKKDVKSVQNYLKISLI